MVQVKSLWANAEVFTEAQAGLAGAGRRAAWVPVGHGAWLRGAFWEGGEASEMPGQCPPGWPLSPLYY